MTIRRANVLWIRSDPLSGGSRSQVEFPVEAGPFFGGRPTPSFGDALQISILSAGVRFRGKRMDFHHNSVWRLNLPTERQGLGPYSRKILCFERTQEENLYRLTLIPLDSALEHTLRRSTRRQGSIKTTLPDGTREYGSFRNRET